MKNLVPEVLGKENLEENLEEKKNQDICTFVVVPVAVVPVAVAPVVVVPVVVVPVVVVPVVVVPVARAVVADN